MIAILVAGGSCDCGPTDPPPPPDPCWTTVVCVAACEDLPSTFCNFCPSGTFEESLCTDSGLPPRDGGSCEDIPCAIANECGYACGEVPFYVGCCDCPMGTIDLRSSCSLDAGPPRPANNGSAAPASVRLLRRRHGHGGGRGASADRRGRPPRDRRAVLRRQAMRNGALLWRDRCDRSVPGAHLPSDVPAPRRSWELVPQRSALL